MDQKMLDHLFEGAQNPVERAQQLDELQSVGFMPTDEEPTEWVDEHVEPTEEEIRRGNYLSDVIDPDDDHDNGGFQ